MNDPQSVTHEDEIDLLELIKILWDDKIKIIKNLLFLLSIHKIMFLFEIFDFLILKLDICNDIIILMIWKLVKVVALLGQMTLFGCLMQY